MEFSLDEIEYGLVLSLETLREVLKSMSVNGRAMPSTPIVSRSGTVTLAAMIGSTPFTCAYQCSMRKRRWPEPTNSDYCLIALLSGQSSRASTSRMEGLGRTRWPIWSLSLTRFSERYLKGCNHSAMRVETRRMLVKTGGSRDEVDTNLMGEV